MPPLVVEVISLCTSFKTFLSTSIVELSHDLFAVEDMIVRERRVLNKFEERRSGCLGMGSWCVHETYDSDFLICMSFRCIVVRG